MNTSQSPKLKDHRWGAGRIDPERLRNALFGPKLRTHAPRGVFHTVETILLAILLIAAMRDISPVEAIKWIVAGARAAIEWVIKAIVLFT